MEIEFESLELNTLDPTSNTVRTTLSYLDPPGSGNRLITRNGAIFGLPSQKIDDEKLFLANVPACSGTSTIDIQNWYHVFTVHVTAHGFFIQPYFCFALSPMQRLVLPVVMIPIQ